MCVVNEINNPSHSCILESVNYINGKLLNKMFQDAKMEIRSRKSKKRQYTEKKRTIHDRQNTMQKNKRWSTAIPTQNGGSGSPEE